MFRRSKSKCVDKTPITAKQFRRFRWQKWIVWWVLLATLLLMLYKAGTPAQTVANGNSATEVVATTVPVAATEIVATAMPDLPAGITPITFGSFELGDMRSEPDVDGVIVPFNLTGEAEAGATIEFGYDDNLVGNALVDDDGKWAFQKDVPLPAGDHEFYARMITQDGTKSDLFSLTTVSVPELATIQSPTMQVTGGGTTTLDGLVLTGTADPEAEVQILINEDVHTTVVADADGNWVYAGNLPAGEYSIIARIVTPEGMAIDSTTETVAIAEPDIFAMAEADGNFTILLAAIEATDLSDSVAGLDEITLFAPTDDAFNQLPSEIQSGLLDNPEFLRSLLLRHVVVGNFHSDGLTDGQALVTGAGTPLTISATESATGLAVNGVPISLLDIAGNNGVIHGIDAIMLPEFSDPPPTINAEGVPVFEGDVLTVVGKGQIDMLIILTLNGETFGETTVDENGNWQITNDITPGEYDIIAYAMDENELLHGVSDTLHLIAK